jgi:hypothetical protein
MATAQGPSSSWKYYSTVCEQFTFGGQTMGPRLGNCFLLAVACLTGLSLPEEFLTLRLLACSLGGLMDGHVGSAAFCTAPFSPKFSEPRCSWDTRIRKRNVACDG